ncbi:hypothetical protein JD844_013462 [Phrynosoma platyrhinos]|uniref:Glycoprotein n=1 Tax=Phrynosoma platyrhinos TaxID=52577 RepID=A0ABQ7TL87_PHRPL|nr:hypothetical protein JD844_013462 [Phrynosoma platyrhinos]
MGHSEPSTNGHQRSFERPGPELPMRAIRDPKRHTTACPSTNISLPEDSSRVIAANVSTYPNMLVLCKNNCDQEILILKKGHANYVDFAYMDHFYISGNDLAIKNTSKMLTGYPSYCSSTNFSLLEDSSEIIIDPMSSNSHVFDLYMKDNFSSHWQHILNIANRQLDYVRKDYEGHFMISEGGLAIKNATEGLTGEYQLADSSSESCKQFFLSMSALLSLWSCISLISKRREGNRNESVHNFTNGSLQNEKCTLQGNEMNGQIQKIQQESVL